MVINLGSGHIRLQASAKALNDGLWHSVVMERSGRRGVLSVDALRTDFSCPGRSANLNIEEPIFLGAVPWESAFLARKRLPEAVTVIQLMVDGDGTEEKAAAQRYPSTVWTIGLRIGFMGCLKNIRVNGINAQIANAFRAAKLSSEIRDAHERDDGAALPYNRMLGLK
uniref:Laminin G domain-containing protein n=1 Tax=Globodera rostochiensis TaxID=31243 RepID=A0A914HF38_GLORO